MALVIADRVRETSSSTGTGTITLTGAFLGFQPFSVIGDGNTTYYAIIDATAGAFEVGIGTFTTSGNTLSRSTVLSSSNSGNLVNFAAGLKDVICTQPSARAVYVEGSDVVARNNAKVPNSLLANSGITFGSTAQALGSTVTALNGVSIGATTPATGSFTSLTTSSTVTHNGGTANGVAFLNASKVLTTGSALTFDGTQLNAVGAVVGVATPLRVSNSSATTNGRGAGLEFFGASNTFGRIEGFFAGTDEQVRLFSTGSMTFSTAGSEQMRLTSTGLGIGTSSPGARLHVNGGTTEDQIRLGQDSNFYKIGRDTVQGPLVFTGTQTGVVGFVFKSNATEFARIDSSGNMQIGSNGGPSKLNVFGDNPLTLFNAAATSSFTVSAGQNSQISNFFSTGSSISFGTNASGGGVAERMRIDSAGNVLVGTTTPKGLLTVAGGTSGGASVQAGFGGINATSFQIFHADDGGSSATACVAKIEKVSSTSRSVNAAGTINASGADYAEYMTKAGEFTVAKGDVVGINAEGKLTNVFAEAISFCVKSTDPSYVGNDKWGCNFEEDQEGLEAARQCVDRIAFAGQVPVNVLGATPGQFIIPVKDNGAIAGQAVSNPTFEQYQISVGKVIAVEGDGRARIIVKVS